MIKYQVRYSNNLEYAYSFGHEATFPGYMKELIPMCYGWSDDEEYDQLLFDARVNGSEWMKAAQNKCQTLSNVSDGQVNLSA